MLSTIHKHRWHPAQGAVHRSRGVYLLHGIGEHAGRYDRLAKRLTALGFEVGAHDHPGHGKSAGKQGIISSSQQLEMVAAEQFSAFAKETGTTPYLFGHSLGGLVATSMVLSHNVNVAGLMLSAPAYAPFISFANRIKLFLLNLIAPTFTQKVAANPQVLTHDKDEQQKSSNDPLNHQYKSASIVMWLLKTGQQALDNASEISVPTLVLIAGEDMVTDSLAIQEFAGKLSPNLLTEHRYTDFRHEILNETPERREQVLNDIENWLIALEE